MLAAQGSQYFDAKYDRQQLRQEAIAQAESDQLPLQILHCTAPGIARSLGIPHR